MNNSKIIFTKYKIITHFKIMGKTRRKGPNVGCGLSLSVPKLRLFGEFEFELQS